MTAYYNEFDPKAAAWLRELIKRGLIADGIVDERSITEVSPNDVRGFDQCHWFAGVGGWSYSLRIAGIPDEYPVWTASLPCQPFSAAGKKLGKADERHLLPHFLDLVRECQPSIIFGEQVPGAIRHGWLDDLYTEMEASSYAVGSIIAGAHSIGAPHIRQRLYWVANAAVDRREQRPADNEWGAERNSEERTCRRTAFGGDADGMADSSRAGSQRHRGAEQVDVPQGWQGAKRFNGESGVSDGIWSNPEWLYCRDNKYRSIKRGLKPTIPSIKSSTFKVVDGITRRMVRSGDSGEPINANETAEARVMRLKGYGNAIVPQVAAEFIRAFMEVAQ